MVVLHTYLLGLLNVVFNFCDEKFVQEDSRSKMGQTMLKLTAEKKQDYKLLKKSAFRKV